MKCINCDCEYNKKNNDDSDDDSENLCELCDNIDYRISHFFACRDCDRHCNYNCVSRIQDYLTKKIKILEKEIKQSKNK